MKKKRMVVNRSDSRLDFGRGRAKLFLVRRGGSGKRRDSTEKLGKLSKLFAVSGIVLALAVFSIIIFFVVVSFIKVEVTGTDSSAASAVASVDASPLPEYDSMGLPIYGDEFNLFYINANKPQDADYVPDTAEYNGIQVHENIIDALRLMVQAAKNDGLALAFTRGYTSYEKQEEIFNTEVQNLIKEKKLTTIMANVEAQKLVPLAGQSDMQSAMCVGLAGGGESFYDSQTYQWLNLNAGKYGFVFRYPDGKEEYTGVQGDPTILRYVGYDNAMQMRRLSMCLEEYADYLSRQ